MVVIIIIGILIKNSLTRIFYLCTNSKLTMSKLDLDLMTKKLKGPTAYSTEKFINSLKIPDGLKLGVMINAGDFLNKKKPFKKLN